MTPEKAASPGVQTSPSSGCHPGRRSLRTPNSGGGAEARAQQAQKRRHAAAQWVEDLTGVAMPADSDKHFRDALKDGTLLCQVLNIIRPGCITQVRSRRLK